MPKSKARQKQRPNYAKRVQKKLEAAQRLNPFIKSYLQKLEAENELLKTSPDTAMGQLIPQLREAVSQNKRLSVLSAALIDAQGGSVTLSKEVLESFESKVLSIKWQLPEGVTDAATAPEFIFRYEALTQEEHAAQEAARQAEAQSAQITLTPLNEGSATLVSTPVEETEVQEEISTSTTEESEVESVELS